MGGANRDVNILDYGYNVSGVANAVTTLGVARLSGKLGISYTVYPSAGAAGTVQLQVTDFSNNNTVQNPLQANTFANLGTATTIVAGVPISVQVSNVWARNMRLVVTAGAGSTGTFQIALSLRGAYA